MQLEFLEFSNLAQEDEVEEGFSFEIISPVQTDSISSDCEKHKSLGS